MSLALLVFFGLLLALVFVSYAGIEHRRGSHPGPVLASIAAHTLVALALITAVLRLGGAL